MSLPTRSPDWPMELPSCAAREHRQGSITLGSVARAQRKITRVMLPWEH